MSTYTSNIPYIARLFEVNDKNLAYIYSDQHLRNQIGDEIYGDDEKKMDDNSDDEKKMNDNNDDESDEDEFESTCCQLLFEWGLPQYMKILIDENGYDDVESWNDLSVAELKRYGFRERDAKIFVKKTRAYLNKLND